MINSPASSKKMILGLLMLGLGLLVGLFWFSGFENAVSAAPPPRNTATPPPTATPIVSQIAKPDMPVGAFITLYAQSGTWTVVQWQDVKGNWHDVDGWRGSTTAGTVSWWVAQKDFGTGPFRWAMNPSKGGELSAASEAFQLPTGANQTLIITMP